MKKKKQIIALIIIITGYVVIYREMVKLSEKKSLTENRNHIQTTKEGINFQSKKVNIKNEKLLQQNFVGENEITGVTKPISLNSKQFNRTISSDPFASYKRLRIKMENDIKLELIEGISASFKKIESQKEIVKMNGYYIYHESEGTEANVVYDSNLNRYGVITNEISIRGSKEKIQKLADKYGLELMSEISMGSSHILKAQDTSFFTSREFSDFQKELGVNDIKPNVNYSLKNHH